VFLPPRSVSSVPHLAHSLWRIGLDVSSVVQAEPGTVDFANVFAILKILDVWNMFCLSSAKLQLRSFLILSVQRR
jgi:hypothetical protein